MRRAAPNPKPCVPSGRDLKQEWGSKTALSACGQTAASRIGMVDWRSPCGEERGESAPGSMRARARVCVSVGGGGQRARLLIARVWPREAVAATATKRRCCRPARRSVARPARRPARRWRRESRNLRCRGASRRGETADTTAWRRARDGRCERTPPGPSGTSPPSPAHACSYSHRGTAGEGPQGRPGHLRPSRALWGARYRRCRRVTRALLPAVAVRPLAAPPSSSCPRSPLRPLRPPAGHTAAA